MAAGSRGPVKQAPESANWEPGTVNTREVGIWCLPFWEPSLACRKFFGSPLDNLRPKNNGAPRSQPIRDAAAAGAERLLGLSQMQTPLDGLQREASGSMYLHMGNQGNPT